jgi:hypothetical protein
MKWEDICSPQTGDYLERIKVPGGWLYRTVYVWDTTTSNTSAAVAMVFVPDKSK